MIAHFKGIDIDGNVTKFDSACEYENGIYKFVDLSTENTIIYIQIEASTITITRKGNTDMELFLVRNEKTSGYFKNNLGLEFEFSVLTDDLSINSDRIYASYSLFVENDLVNSQKMWILFN